MDEKQMTGYVTGQVCSHKGVYMFGGYLVPSDSPFPGKGELVISLSPGEFFPPIKSSKKACLWNLVTEKQP
jgi:hypothetical protein